MNKIRKRKRGVVISSSDEEVAINTISYPVPCTRRITRSMIKAKGSKDQTDVTPILIEDNSKDKKFDPQLDLGWTDETEKGYGYCSPL